MKKTPTTEDLIDKLFDNLLDSIETIREIVKRIESSKATIEHVQRQLREDNIDKKIIDEYHFPDAMDTKQAAKYLGLSLVTLHGWRHYKKGPAYSKIGRRIVYHKKDLDRYIEDRRCESK